MKLFSRLYLRMIQWAEHPYAAYYLAGISFLEASLFPLPPDVMLIPMSLARPHRAWYYAGITTLFSVLGGLVGYAIGMFFFEWISPWLIYLGYMPTYQKIQLWFDHWGIWVLLLAVITPIPFKLFSITAGTLHIFWLPFLMAALAGRAIRFYVVAALMRLGGPKMHHWLTTRIDQLGWFFLSFLGIVCVACIFLTGCSIPPAQKVTPRYEAPIVEGWRQAKKAGQEYHVRTGDTIYSIAWAFDEDYHTIASLNHLREPYALSPGEVLQMPGPRTVSMRSAETTPVSVPPHSSSFSASLSPASHRPAPSYDVHSQEKSPPFQAEGASVTASSRAAWVWPTQGNVVRAFSSVPQGNKGLDIEGRLGQPIVAAAAGKVVYAGNSLPGYGNLIILKHTNNDLSAYAFNQTILVKEGEWVKSSQTIGTMGKNTTGETRLHFEIRKKGKPIDPLTTLPRKS